MKKLKIKFITEPILSNDGNVKLTFCRAPEGTLIEMVQELKMREFLNKDIIITGGSGGNGSAMYEVFKKWCESSQFRYQKIKFEK